MGLCTHIRSTLGDGHVRLDYHGQSDMDTFSYRRLVCCLCLRMRVVYYVRLSKLKKHDLGLVLSDFCLIHWSTDLNGPF